jgi:hypothetical protein
MYHFSEAKKGLFYLNKEDRIPVPVPNGQPAFLRFADKHGVADDLWDGEGISASAALQHANLAWPVEVRPVLVPSSTGGLIEARDYRALVRPDTEDVMSVVTTTFHIAENDWVIRAAERFSERLGAERPLIGAVGFGRDHERTAFIGRIRVDESSALCLLAYNQHSEGAVRFQLIEVDRHTGTVYAPASTYASTTLSHVGDMRMRLELLAQPSLQIRVRTRPDLDVTFIEQYLDDTQPRWDRMADTLWTPKRTSGLIDELLKAPKEPAKGTERSDIDPDDDEAKRYPGPYLRDSMRSIDNAASAYKRICYYLDHESEACERGDFTKNRDERLALGAGLKLKQRAWTWIADNT